MERRPSSESVRVREGLLLASEYPGRGGSGALARKCEHNGNCSPADKQPPTSVGEIHAATTSPSQHQG